MSLKRYTDEKCISPDVMKKLPSGRFIRIEKIRDMNGALRTAILFSHKDRMSIRNSYFCMFTGEYLGEM